MFDQQKVAQEMFNLSKNHWMMTMDMVTAFQEQNDKMWHTLMEQGLITQAEGKKVFIDWMDRAKQARDQFNNTITDNLKKMETVFTTPKTGK